MARACYFQSLVRPTVPLALLLALTTSQARAAECAARGGYSGCIDANALWLRPGAEGFVSVPSSRSTPAARVAFGVAAMAIVRPLVLEVPSPDPDGREVRLVDYAIDENVLLAAGLGYGVELGVTLTSVLHQRGSGSEGITSQRAAALASATERDVRLSVAYAAPAGAQFGLKPRFELSVPAGDESAYASEGTLVAAPGLSASAALGRFTLAGLLALRLRRAVELGPVRWGSQAELALAADALVLTRPNIAFTLETFALPSLGSATSRRGRSTDVSVTLIPAEWLASVRIQPDTAEPWFVSAGAGTGLALSAEERAGTRRALFAPTTPAFRGVLSVRYAPSR